MRHYPMRVRASDLQSVYSKAIDEGARVFTDWSGEITSVAATSDERIIIGFTDDGEPGSHSVVKARIFRVDIEYSKPPDPLLEFEQWLLKYQASSELISRRAFGFVLNQYRAEVLRKREDIPK